jgi:hypothetical protein
MTAFHRKLLRPIGAIACLAAELAYGQDKSSDVSGKPAAQGEPTRTVIVNGVAEPVYRGGSKGITSSANVQPSAGLQRASQETQNRRCRNARCRRHFSRPDDSDQSLNEPRLWPRREGNRSGKQVELSARYERRNTCFCRDRR